MNAKSFASRPKGQRNGNRDSTKSLNHQEPPYSHVSSPRCLASPPAGVSSSLFVPSATHFPGSNRRRDSPRFRRQVIRNARVYASKVKFISHLPRESGDWGLRSQDADSQLHLRAGTVPSASKPRLGLTLSGQRAGGGHSGLAPWGLGIRPD